MGNGCHENGSLSKLLISMVSAMTFKLSAERYNNNTLMEQPLFSAEPGLIRHLIFILFIESKIRTITANY